MFTQNDASLLCSKFAIDSDHTHRELVRKHYDAEICHYYNDGRKQLHLNISKNLIKDDKYNNQELLGIILHNTEIYMLDMLFNNNNITILYNNGKYKCCVLDGNYKFEYTYNIEFKDTFISIIKKHGFAKNIIDLFDIIKYKIHILKLYFINIDDIYKYVLPIFSNICFNDDILYLELFFKQYMRAEIRTS